MFTCMSPIFRHCHQPVCRQTTKLNHRYHTGTWLICPTLMCRWLMDEEHGRSRGCPVKRRHSSHLEKRICLQPNVGGRLMLSQRLYKEPSFISYQRWTVTRRPWPQACCCVTLSVDCPLLSRYWRDTGHLILLWCNVCRMCWASYWDTNSSLSWDNGCSPPQLVKPQKNPFVILMWPLLCSFFCLFVCFNHLMLSVWLRYRKCLWGQQCFPPSVDGSVAMLSGIPESSSCLRLDGST